VLKQVFNEGLQELILAHMSETNNSPEMLLKAFSSILDHPMREHLNITLASQHGPIDLVNIS